MDSPKPHLLLKQPPIQAQIRIPQQLLLHKRRQWRRIAYPSVLLQIRPGVQRLIVHLINHVVEIHARKRIDQRTVEAGFDLERIVHEGRHCALGCSGGLANCIDRGFNWGGGGRGEKGAANLQVFP